MEITRLDATVPIDLPSVQGPIGLRFVHDRLQGSQKRAGSRLPAEAGDVARRIIASGHGKDHASIVILMTVVLHAEDWRLADDIGQRLTTDDLQVHLVDLQWLERVFGELGIVIEATTARNPLASDAIRTAWQQNRASRIANLRGQCRRGQVSLVLGAGLSMGLKIPSWDVLVSRLVTLVVERTVPELGDFGPRERALCAKIIADQEGGSQIRLARYIRNALSTLEEPIELVGALRSALYAELDEAVISRDPLLAAVVRLCVSNRVKHVLTYNFDDLLEEALDLAGKKYASVCGTRPEPHRDLVIWHVHGLIPRTGGDAEVADPEDLIFSEEGYHRVGREPLGWSNVTQVMHFRDSCCLFVGTSLTDPNLRRLLHEAARGGISEHFAILRREAVGTYLKSYGPADERAIATFLAVHHDMLEKVLAELGVRPIWVEHYDEVPGIIDLLRVEDEAGGAGTEDFGIS